MLSLPLADELFLIGHDEYTGKAAVNSELIDSGLVGAVLGELMLAGRAALTEGRITVRDPRPHGESVTDAALAEILKQKNAHPVRAWVEYLREDVRAMVGTRLVDAGVVRREQTRGLTLRSVVRYPATEPVRAARPRVRMRYLLERGERLDLQTAVAAALVRATEMEHVLLLDAGRQQARERLGQIAAALPAELQALSSGVEAAVAAIALTVRR
jgi:Golgi phosphoprotein 3 GPP34